MIKTVENVEYIVLHRSNVPWVWSREHNLYGVHPRYERKFIAHIALLRSLGFLCSLGLSSFTQKINGLIVVYLAAYIFWECSIV